MAERHHRTRVAITLLVGLVLVAALAAACSAQASGGSLSGGTSSSAGTGATAGASSASPAAGGAAKAASGADWTRIAAALAWMQAATPTKPVVVLLGGSAARESTISDQSWRDQIVAKGGPDTLAWNMGSRNRTMAQNLAIVQALPEASTIVFIGVNLGSFTSAQKTATVSLPSPAPTEPPSLQQPHSYTASDILTSSQKKALVKQWLSDRYPVFQRNFSTSAAVMEKLIRVCRTRGFKPVLFELPRNTNIIGSSLSTPTTRYRTRCRALAAEYGIPWISLVSTAKLPNRSFYDLWHLVEPGRTTWQDLLSARTLALLQRYGYDGSGP